MGGGASSAAEDKPSAKDSPPASAPPAIKKDAPPKFAKYQLTPSDIQVTKNLAARLKQLPGATSSVVNDFTEGGERDLRVVVPIDGAKLPRAFENLGLVLGAEFEQDGDVDIKLIVTKEPRPSFEFLSYWDAAAPTYAVQKTDKLGMGDTFGPFDVAREIWLNDLRPACFPTLCVTLAHPRELARFNVGAVLGPYLGTAKTLPRGAGYREIKKLVQARLSPADPVAQPPPLPVYLDDAAEAIHVSLPMPAGAAYLSLDFDEDDTPDLKMTMPAAIGYAPNLAVDIINTRAKVKKRVFRQLNPNAQYVVNGEAIVMQAEFPDVDLSVVPLGNFDVFLYELDDLSNLWLSSMLEPYASLPAYMKPATEAPLPKVAVQ